MSIYKKSAKLALLFVLIFLLVQIRHHTFPVQGQGINYSVYMPLIQNGGQTGNLDNLGTVEHADGVGVGAYGTTLTQPINVDISSVTAPATPLPAGVQALAGYYQIRADADTYVSPTAPFVLAFPIPAGSPTGNLALGVLLPGEDYLDWEPSEPVWDFLEGKYDSARNLFLTTIPFLAQDGHTFVLVDHPDIPSVPIQHLPARVTGASSGNFVVICRGFHHGECPEAAEDQVGSLLDELYTTFSDLSYPEPRLRALIEPLEWPPNAPAPAFWQYAIYLEPLLNCRIGTVNIIKEPANWSCVRTIGQVALPTRATGTKRSFTNTSMPCSLGSSK
jgi:hypothetical protein